MTIQTLEVQNQRLKSLRSNQPSSVKAQHALRRQFMRKESFGSLSDLSGNESPGDVDESWYNQNRSIITELDNVGLKTPKSVKKALKRRTVKIEKAGCKCKGNCGSKSCGCVKLEDRCGGSCKCNVERCKNRADGCDPELEISLHIPKINPQNLLSDLESIDEWEKENNSGHVVSDDSGYDLISKKRSSSNEEASSKKIKQRKS